MLLQVPRTRSWNAVGLLQEQKVAVVPGTAFGDNGKGHVRACFATAYDQIIEACDRVERFVQRAGKGQGARG